MSAFVQGRHRPAGSMRVHFVVKCRNRSFTSTRPSSKAGWEDIRSLARDAGENAGRIKDTVRAIQGRITAVRSELEQIVSAAEAENQKTTAVLAGLHLVETEMGHPRPRLGLGTPDRQPSDGREAEHQDANRATV